MTECQIKQIKTGPLNNFTYVIACGDSKKAAVIDPSGALDEILAYLNEHGLELAYIINTHHHNDHVAENAALKAKTGALVVMHYLDNKYYLHADRVVEDGDTIDIGDINIMVIHTPGHTPGGICLLMGDNLFTGDTLFVGDSGRTDLPGGNRDDLGASIRRLMLLPEDTKTWPGHDYGNTPTSTLAWEKRNNVNAVEYGFYVND